MEAQATQLQLPALTFFGAGDEGNSDDRVIRGHLHEQPLPCLLPGIAARAQYLQLPLQTSPKRNTIGSASPEKAQSMRRAVTFAVDAQSPVDSVTFPDKARKDVVAASFSRRPPQLTLGTPSSCASASCRYALTPCTPDPRRQDMYLLSDSASVVLFDFDGTLTRSAGTAAQRCRRQVEAELQDRAMHLAPRLRALRDAGRTLGILSKSTKQTILSALQAAGLAEFFDATLIIGSAIGLGGKAGIIEDLVGSGLLFPSASIDDNDKDIQHHLRRVALIDDDVRELERCKVLGIQTYPAPEEGGLQEEDFDDIFDCLGLSNYMTQPSVSREAV